LKHEKEVSYRKGNSPTATTAERVRHRKDTPALLRITTGTENKRRSSQMSFELLARQRQTEDRDTVAVQQDPPAVNPEQLRPSSVLFPS